jgi:hypothetical protein
MPHLCVIPYSTDPTPQFNIGDHLWQQPGKYIEARELPALVYGRCSEGMDVLGRHLRRFLIQLWGKISQVLRGAPYVGLDMRLRKE